MNRVVFANRFYYPDESATSLMLTDLATGLARAGHDVTVVTSRQKAAEPGAALPSTETCDGVTVIRVRTSTFGRSGLAGRALDYVTFFLAALLVLRRVLRPGDVLVVMTDPPLLSVIATPLARRRCARLVNWLQDLYPETAMALGVLAPGGRLARVLTRWRNRTLRAADRNVAIGEQMAARIRALGVPAERVTVIPNWADGATITPLAHRDNPLRNSWLDEDAFAVVYSGNLGRAHLLGGLLGAAGHIASAATRPHGETAARVRFLFIGGGHQQARLQAMAERQGLANVVFRPFQPRARLHESLGVADLHVVALKPGLDGLIVPSKLYGALAAGRPVLFLGAADSEVSRLLASRGCGATAEPDDPQSIAQEILAYAADPQRCRHEGDNARRLFDESFDRDRAVQAWIDLLQALDGPAPARHRAGRHINETGNPA